jgi:hypothetical protein
MTKRTLLGVVTAATAIGAATVEYARTGSPGEAAKALLAGLLAVAVAALAVSLPGVTLRGAVIGGFFVAAGIFTWTFTNRPLVIWAVLVAEGAVFALWAWPWLRHVRTLSRLGSAWLGLAYWFLGVAGAVLVLHAGVAAQRLAYAGVFTLAALAVVASVRRPGERPSDVSVGIVAAVLVGIAALFLAGSGNLLDSVHVAPNTVSGQLMRDRFWGDHALMYHPNSMSSLAVIVALRIGPDRAFAVWQRLAATGLVGVVLLLTNSRIGFVFAVSAALVHAVLFFWRRGRRTGLPEYRRPWLAILAPFAVLALVLVISGGRGFVFQNRFGGDDVTSGRTATWKQVITDWRHAGLAEKVFGDAKTSRAVVTRLDDGEPPEGPRRKLNTDNAAVGALRRGGVLGELAFLFGLGLLLWHAVRRRPDGSLPAAWFTVAAVGAVPTIATEDWLLGGTNGVVWILLLAGEAVAVRYGVLGVAGSGDSSSGASSGAASRLAGTSPSPRSAV